MPKDSVIWVYIVLPTLRDLPKKDPSFPKCYKFGNTCQAPVYYDYADLLAWHNAQKEKVNGVEV